MKRLLLTTASLAVAMSLAAAAYAQQATVVQTPDGTAYGAPVSGPPVGTVPPAARAPAGWHYEWIYGYVPHGTYRGHWELVRSAS